MMLRITRLAGAAVAALAISAIPVSSALADNNPSITISIENQAHLLADGSVNVTVTYSCLPGFGSGSTGAISGTLEQTQAAGQSSGTAVCDDQNHTIVLNMSPGPFTRGTAAASVTIVSGFNQQQTQQAEVQVS